MITHYAPTDHVGHYTFPEGCTDAQVYNCPALTSITVPEGCADLWVNNCHNLTSVTAPDGCDVQVLDCPNYTP